MGVLVQDAIFKISDGLRGGPEGGLQSKTGTMGVGAAGLQ